MDERLAHAFLPPTCKIAGRRISFFTLWGRFLLEALENPFALGGTFGPEDLVAAVKIVRARHGRPFSMRPTLRDFYWISKYKRNPRRFKRDAEIFDEWIGLQHSPPKYWKKPSALSGQSEQAMIDRTPSTLGLACSLMARAGFSKSDAWNTPIGEARWMDAQLAKMEGAGICFLDDADLLDTADPFEGLSDSEVLEHFRSNFGDEERAVRAFEDWKARNRPS